MIDQSKTGLKNWSELYMDNQHSKGDHMDTTQLMEERLWDYIDGLGNSAEKAEVEALIAANMEWQRKYGELLEVNQAMNSTDLDEPSMRFTKNVMEQIARYHVAPATKSYVNKNIIRSIGAFFLLMIGGFFVYVLGQFKWSIAGSANILPQYSINADRLNWGKILSGPYATIFVMVMVILGLVLLDTYMQRKRQQRLHIDSGE
jgi:hypothetical protein